MFDYWLLINFSDEETDPVEEEGGEKCSEENKIVAEKGDILFPFPVIPPGHQQ